MHYTSSDRETQQSQRESFMHLSVMSDDGDVVRLQCEGEIGRVDLEDDVKALAELLGDGFAARRALLSLEQARSIDSSGVGWLLTCHKLFDGGGGRLVCHSAPPLVEDVLELLRLPRVLHLAKDEAAARTLAAEGKS